MTTPFLDEMYGSCTLEDFAQRRESGQVRAPYRPIDEWLRSTDQAVFASKREEADLIFRRVGITFNVYGDQAGTERLIPFDIIPRVLSAAEWERLAAGLVQRVKALNMFLHDIYHRQEVVRARVVPESHLLRNSLFRPEMKGVDVPGNVYVHIAGIDIVRVEEGTFYVLEDNLRTPSGVSYMLQNRAVMMRLFPQVFAKAHVAPVDHYSQELLRTLRSVAPATTEGEPTVVVMTPGPHNSAYFEHTFLAEQMGVELAEVCQDHAHVFVSCCRQLSIPARYVSGYLAPKNGPANANGADTEMASHAWAEAWIEGVGWQGFDVANQVRAHGRHVRVSVGLDYLDACPVRGFHRGGTGESLGVEVHVDETLYRQERGAESSDEGADQQ